MGSRDDIDPQNLVDHPDQLREWLTDRNVFRFGSYRSGLFPASDLSPDLRAATGMGMAWFRDNAHVAAALLDDGRVEEAVRAGSAMLAVLHANRRVLRGDDPGYLTVRVDGDDLTNDHEARVQHDSTGYALWLVSRLAREGHLRVDREDVAVLSETAGYLVRVRYWQSEDEGHWEEERLVHASSIGTAVAGLRAVVDLLRKSGVESTTDLPAAIRAGESSLTAMLDSGRTDLPGASGTDGPHRDECVIPATVIPTNIDAPADTRRFLDEFNTAPRRHDAALLFLIEPLGVLAGARADAVVAGVESHLVRRHGVARYRGDTYWEPRFPAIMTVDERTSAAEGRTERRNLTAAGVAFTATEAQWTLFDPVLSSYWGRRYLESGHPEDRARQRQHLCRSLEQLTRIGDRRQGLPEAYYLEFDDAGRANRWIANDHTPLLWSHANLLRALGTLERTTR